MAVVEQPLQLEDFDKLLASSLENFVDASSILGEPVKNLALKVKELFLKSRDLIEYGLSNQEPSQDSPIMESYYDLIKQIVELKESSDPPYTNHFSTVGTAIYALGWISIETGPHQFVRDMREAGEYFGNRVMSQNRGDQENSNWVYNWSRLLSDLQNYVAKHFKTGFTWNALNMAIAAAEPQLPPLEIDIAAAGDGQRQALVNQLNQGSGITRNLRPLSRRSPGLHVPRPIISFAERAAIRQQLHPPKLLLEGKKWIVEYQRGNAKIIIPNDDMSQSLAVFKCEDSGLKVENKMKGVVIDSCKKLNVVLKSVISSVELIRCNCVTIQCDGNVPCINLDNCDSIQMFLTPASRNVEIFSSKSNACNICILESNGDYKELSIPEQIKSVLKGKKLESIVVEKI